MDGPRALPAWLIFLLIAIGVAFAVGIALLLTQLDSLQRRTLLPQGTLSAVDQDATAAAAAVTVIVISGENSLTSTATSTITATPPGVEEAVVTETSVAVLIPTCAAAPADWIPYTIQEGDTVASLAYNYGTSILTLMQANCLEHEQLVPGKVILLPALTPTPATEETVCAVPAGWIQHMVGPDESLSSLAEEHMVSVLMLMRANCLEKPAVTPGRIIFLPPAMTTVPLSPTSMHRPPAQRTPMWRPMAHPSPTWFWRPSMPAPTLTQPFVPPPTATNKPELVASATASRTATSTPSTTPQPSVTPTATATLTATVTATSTPAATDTAAPPTITATSAAPYPGQQALPTSTSTATATATVAAYP